MDKARIKNIVMEVLNEIKVNNPGRKILVRIEGNQYQNFMLYKKDNPWIPDEYFKWDGELDESFGVHIDNKYMVFVPFILLNKEDALKNIDKVINFFNSKGIKVIKGKQKDYPRVLIPIEYIKLADNRQDLETARKNPNVNVDWETEHDDIED